MSGKHKIFNLEKEIRVASTKESIFTNKFVVPYLFLESIEQSDDYFINVELDEINQIIQDAVKNIVLRRALYMESLKSDIVISDAEIEDILDEISEGETEYFDKKYGVERRFFLNEAKISGSVKKYREYLLQNSGVDVEEAEIASFYENNPSLSYVKPRAIASHIFFLTENLSEYHTQKKFEKAQTVVKKLGEGADFGKMARLYSEEEGSKYIGGTISEYIEKGMLVKELDDAIFNMKEGELSPVIKTVFGYHIVKLDKIIEERRKSADELRDEIVYILKIKKEREYLAKYFEKTLKKRKFKISNIIGR
jgi:parvulin-like peptidyl-prolyl isomerase